MPNVTVDYERFSYSIEFFDLRIFIYYYMFETFQFDQTFINFVLRHKCIDEKPF